MFQLVPSLSSMFQAFCCLPLMKCRIENTEKCCTDIKENGQFTNCCLSEVLMHRSDRIFTSLCISSIRFMDRVTYS